MVLMTGFFFNELDQGITGLFGERPVGPPRPGPVEVPDVHIGQVLARRIMDINFGVRPLVERIRPAVAHAESLAAPLGRDRVGGGISAARPGHGRRAPVG
jgi:hypothetical protein